MVAQYKKIGLPEELMDEIDYIIDDKMLGYRTKAEFAAEACRRLLTEVVKVKQMHYTK